MSDKEMGNVLEEIQEYLERLQLPSAQEEMTKDLAGVASQHLGIDEPIVLLVSLKAMARWQEHSDRETAEALQVTTEQRIRIGKSIMDALVQEMVADPLIQASHDEIGHAIDMCAKHYMDNYIRR